MSRRGGARLLPRWALATMSVATELLPSWALATMSVATSVSLGFPPGDGGTELSRSRSEDTRATVRDVDWEDEGLCVWEASLRLAEKDLRDREQRALAEGLSPEARLAIAAEHDTIASARDTVADMHDERAAGRDVAGLQRDVKGSVRDRRSRGLDDDCDPAFPDRVLAGEDRDCAAGDRADSHDDRSRAHAAREHAASDRNRAADDRERAAAQTRSLDELHAALESRRVIGQAQGLLMARHNLSTQEAFAALLRLSQTQNVTLGDIAARLVSGSEPARK